MKILKKNLGFLKIMKSSILDLKYWQLVCISNNRLYVEFRATLGHYRTPANAWVDQTLHCNTRSACIAFREPIFQRIYAQHFFIK